MAQGTPSSGEVLEQLAGAGQRPHLSPAAPYASACAQVELAALLGRDLPPISRSRALTSSPPLIPIRRWIRHTDSSMPARSTPPPGEDVLVDAVHQGAVEVEEERGSPSLATSAGS